MYVNTLDDVKKNVIRVEHAHNNIIYLTNVFCAIFKSIMKILYKYKTIDYNILGTDFVEKSNDFHQYVYHAIGYCKGSPNRNRESFHKNRIALLPICTCYIYYIAICSTADASYVRNTIWRNSTTVAMAGMTYFDLRVRIRTILNDLI